MGPALSCLPADSTQIGWRTRFSRRIGQPFQVLKTPGDVAAFFPGRARITEDCVRHVVVIERSDAFAAHHAKKWGAFHALDDLELFPGAGLPEGSARFLVQLGNALAQRFSRCRVASRLASLEERALLVRRPHGEALESGKDR